MKKMISLKIFKNHIAQTAGSRYNESKGGAEMDTRQIEYMLEIAKENNITRAAQRLFMTQSALNQQLLKLERELGTPLFHRSRTDWRPTEAGEIYLRAAREVLRIKQQSYRMIGDMAETKRGRLSVGLTPGRGIAMFTQVYPLFHQRFPDVRVIPVESSVRNQIVQITAGELDIGFLTVADMQRPNLRFIPIQEEELFLVLPEGHPLCGEAAYLAQVSQEPFVLMYQESSMRPLIDEVFARAGFVPHVLFETASNAAIVTMIQSRLCLGILPAYYLKGQAGIRAFPLPGAPKWHVAACCRKDSYLDAAAAAFIDLATAHWS